MAVSDTLINTLFDGRYRILRKLGTGGMANVYLAEDEVLGRRVAIKILNDRHAGDDQFVERFRREAKNAASLSHPNIVSIYDRGEAEGTYYIAMEYLDGRSLKELIVARGPAPIHLAVDYARQILAAIRFAHRHGIVHRDIKPHNVLVDGEGRLKVTDFGIARAGVSQMTEAGSIIGTAQYLSPEQAKGAPVDQTSDLYSVGVVLYELLTGVVPFSGEGHDAGEQLVEHDTDGVEVRSLVDGCTLCLLGGQVLSGADDRARLGHLADACTRDPEVRHLQSPLTVDQHVVRLDVAVDDAVAVREPNRSEDLARVVDREVDRRGAARDDQLLQRAPVEVLHRDVVGALRLAAVVDRNDVRVREAGRVLRLAAEALDELIVAGMAVVEDLDRDAPAEHLVLSEVNVRHTARAELAQDAI